MSLRSSEKTEIGRSFSTWVRRRMSGECWARPYETLTANVTGTVNLLQSIVDLDLDIFRLDTAGSSKDNGNVREDVRYDYRFTSDGALVLDERSPVNPQSVDAMLKVAADFLTGHLSTRRPTGSLIRRHPGCSTTMDHGRTDVSSPERSSHRRCLATLFLWATWAPSVTSVS